MENKNQISFKLLFHPKEKKCYHLGQAICQNCDKEINDLLIYHIIWGKKKHSQETYCFECIRKLPDNYWGVTEDYICTITEDLPDQCVPIFIFPPQLVNRKGLDVFNVGEIFKNSDAEIIDYTRFSGRSQEQAALTIKKNKELLDEMDQKLGNSAFLIIDQNKEFEEKFSKEIKKGNVKEALKLEKIFVKDKQQSDKEVDQIFNQIQNSVPLIEQEDKKLLGEN